MSKSIVFKKLVEEDIELVRTWRNNTGINKNFINNRFISSEKQLEWFRNIDPLKEKYFMVYYGDEEVGLFYLTQIDKVKLSAEPNGFIGNTKYLDSFVAGKILIVFLKKAFFELGLEILEGKVVLENNGFIKQHELMGAEIDYDHKKGVVFTKITRKNFIDFTDKIEI